MSLEQLLKKGMVSLVTAAILVGGTYAVSSDSLARPRQKLSRKRSQKKQKVVLPHTYFIDTSRKTPGGYSIFQYTGKAKIKSQIAAAFDTFDRKQGDKYDNTGFLNVRPTDHIYYVYARKSKPDTVSTISKGYTKIDYKNPVLAQKIKQGRFEKGFLSDLEQMCARLDMNAMGLLSVMDYETAGTYSPKIRNPRNKATGLIQFTRTTAKGLGTSLVKLRKMSQREQLKYVEDYFELNRDGADYSDPKDIALTIFYPRAVGQKPGYVIGCKDKKCTRFQRLVYRQNRGLDKDKNLKITAREYAAPALNQGYLRYR